MLDQVFPTTCLEHNMKLWFRILLEKKNGAKILYHVPGEVYAVFKETTQCENVCGYSIFCKL